MSENKPFYKVEFLGKQWNLQIHFYFLIFNKNKYIFTFCALYVVLYKTPIKMKWKYRFHVFEEFGQYHPLWLWKNTSFLWTCCCSIFKEMMLIVNTDILYNFPLSLEEIQQTLVPFLRKSVWTLNISLR